MTQDKAHPTPPAVPSDDQWQMPKEPSLFAFINSNPILQSLLYDIDLLPEQIREHRNWFRMVVIVEHFRLALAAPVASNTTAEPAPIQPAGVEVEKDARDAARVLTDFALGKRHHVGLGLCPDIVAGFNSRDPDCKSCAAIDQALAGGAAK